MNENICVVGEREIAMGFRLVGINNTFIAEEEDGAKTLKTLYNSKNYNVILASQSLQKYLAEDDLNLYNGSINPLVVFIPIPGVREEESVYDLAKKILGIDIS